MSVSTNSRAPKVEVGTGAKTAFDFAFKIFDTAGVRIYKETAAGVFTQQTILAEFDPLNPVANSCTVDFDTDAETGTVVYSSAPAAGFRSIIVPDTEVSQGTIFTREGLNPAKSYENVADRLTLELQELSARVDRAPLQPELPPGPGAIAVAAPVANKGLKYTDNGDGTFTIASTTANADDMVTAAAASAAAALASQTAALGSQNSAAVSAAAALASQTAAAASAAVLAASEQSGLYADKPAAPANVVYYYSTDRDSYEKWVPAAGRWFLLG
jgi:hypothetical protein